jgi:DNA-binding PadR family transcriptional regulator
MRFGFQRGFGRHGGHEHGHHMGGRFGGHGFGAWMGAEFEERGGGRGRRRVFDGGELRLVLLRLIGDQPRHGYDLIRAIEERTGGSYAPSPGVVYPTLTLLGDMGLIEEAPSEGNRKVFDTTEEGRRTLEDKAEEIAVLMARLDQLGEMRERTDNSSIRRAMHNLKVVLLHKLGEADVDTLHEAVALIDEAARKIERL